MKNILLISSFALWFVGASFSQESWEEEFEYKENVVGLVDDDLFSTREIVEKQRRDRTFKPNLKSRYNTKEFDYSNQKKKLKEVKPNMALINFIGNLLYFLGIIVIVVIIVLVIRALLLDGGFSRKGKKQKGLYEIVDEKLNFNDVDYLSLVNQAVKSGELKFAIRYYFLAYLQQLNKEQIIEFNPDKTNREYRYEIADIKMRNEFDVLSRIFEYCWYGERDLTEEQFNHAAVNFKQVLIK